MLADGIWVKAEYIVSIQRIQVLQISRVSLRVHWRIVFLGIPMAMIYLVEFYETNIVVAHLPSQFLLLII